MKNGLNFDFNEYENWKKERAYKLQEVVISGFISTLNGDCADEVMNHIFRELLLAAGHTEETLKLFEDLSRGTDHAS